MQTNSGGKSASELAKMADRYNRLAVLERGEVTTYAEQAEFNRLGHEFARLFIGGMLL